MSGCVGDGDPEGLLRGGQVHVKLGSFGAVVSCLAMDWRIFWVVVELDFSMNDWSLGVLICAGTL